MHPSAAVPPTLLFTDCVAVFQGGGCRAAAHAGAYAAARERGVHFHELAGASAGAIVAVLIAAGADPEWLDAKLQDLDFRSFMDAPIGPPNVQLPWFLRLLARTSEPIQRALNLVSYQSLHSGRKIESWVEEALRELLSECTRPKVLFQDLKLPVAVLSAGLREGRAVNYGTESTPDTSVASAVRASCSMPFFFQAVDGQVDGGILSNLPAHLIGSKQDEFRPILAFALEDGSTGNDPEGLLQYSTALVDTVVRGSQELQTQIQPNVHVIQINTGGTRATDFDKITKEEAARLRNVGYRRTSQFFDQENLAHSSATPEFRTYHIAQTWDVLAREFVKAQIRVAVAVNDTRWVFELFSTLTAALMRGVRVRVVLSPLRGQSTSAVYQRQLLIDLGCEVLITPDGAEMPAEAFFFDSGTARAVAVILSTGGEISATIHRESAGESGVLSLLESAFNSATSDYPSTMVQPPTGLAAASEEDVVLALRPVDQYSSDTAIALEEVELSMVNSWAKYAMSYKHRQQQQFVQKFREYRLEPFEPAWLLMANQVRSLIMPPVLEASPGGNQFTIVNGASRLLILQREGKMTARCAVVRGVASPPPAKNPRSLEQLPVRIGRRNDPIHRYDGFLAANVRHVERFAHTLNSLSPTSSGEEHGD